jgi:ABC-type uncharacterized transport system ATPase subunit
LLAQRVHQLRQNVIGNYRLRKVVAVAGEAPQRKRRRLLDAGHIVQQQRAQQLHDARVLHNVHVLRPRGRLRNGCYKGHAGLLVRLKHLQQGGTHLRVTKTAKGYEGTQPY